jgi:hypothetical protein
MDPPLPFVPVVGLFWAPPPIDVAAQPLIDKANVPPSLVGTVALARVTVCFLRVFVAVHVTAVAGMLNVAEVVPDALPPPLQLQLIDEV